MASYQSDLKVRGGRAAPRLRAAVAWAGLTVALCANLQPASIDEVASRRIVSIGDVHGDFERLRALLLRTGLIDTRLRWTGEDSLLVLTGDFIDRGVRVRDTMDLLMALQKEAPASHGEVVVLLGNHEMMNLIGDFRYVASGAFADFTDKKSESRRKRAFESYLKVREREARSLGPPPDPPVSEEQLGLAWMDTHPLGFVEYVEALGPRGDYGKWLRKLPVVFRTDDTLFVHGGIHPILGTLKLSEFNRRVGIEITSFDSIKKYMKNEGWIEDFFALGELLETAERRLASLPAPDPLGDSIHQSFQVDLARKYLEALIGMNQWLSIHADGPLWFRGLAQWTEEEGRIHVDELLRTYQVRRFVVGHTITGELISTRFDDQVFLIDTPEPSALVLEGETATAFYLDREAILTGARARIPAAAGRDW